MKVNIIPEESVFLEGLISEIRKIRSEYMLLKELEKSDLYLRSRFIEIARKQQEYRDPDNAIQVQNLIYGVSVFPLQQAFCKLFNKTNLLKDIVEYIEKVKKSPTMVNYISKESTGMKSCHSKNRSMIHIVSATYGIFR